MSSHPENALEKSSSSYLRTAMYQPVKWHEWCAEAFTAAKESNKPILLDIGAVWCHWCHVMDRESYESVDTAAIINEHFIAVKVDRDERPDVDARYQTAVHAISGQGGWPLTAFLTPDGHPFFGGTYFPPENRYGRLGFPAVLQSVARAWKERRDEAVESAGSVMEAIAHQESYAGRTGEISPAIIEAILDSAFSMFDRDHGGFGSQPKFAHPGALDLILDAIVRTTDSARKEQLENVARVTLQKMATGGVYDQLAGGFHRYSVDAHWIVPHFEKMSYDNSELLKNYAHAAQVFNDPFFAAIARDIVRWVDEWLSDREHGGFYASQDADYSLDDDGDYFTWTLAEARAVLNAEELAIASLYYDIGPVGEMHHDPAKNVLYVALDMEEVAKKTGKTADAVLEILARAKKKMLDARVKRPTPYIDKTIYTGWNGMMISAYLASAQALGLDLAQKFALKSLDRVLAEAWDATTGKLQHVIAYSDPVAVKRPLAGVLDDYVFIALACIDAYEAAGEITYFNSALAIADATIKRFYDSADGGFFDMDSSADPALLLGALTARRKPIQDSPTPSGNSSAVILLTRMFHWTNDSNYPKIAKATLKAFAGFADKLGIFAATYGTGLRLFTAEHSQVVVCGNDTHAEELFAAANKDYSLSKTVVRLRGSITTENLPPALAETIPNLPGVKDGKSVAVVCSGFTCKPPVSDVNDLRKLLEM